MKVLLVDDEISVLTVFGQSLEDAGYSVRCAANGQEAWDLFRNDKKWDAVVVDRAMPGMGGEELARMIKGASPRMTLVMITGAPEAITESLRFDAILAKPFRESELLECLSIALRGNCDIPLWAKVSRWLALKRRAKLRNRSRTRITKNN
jgi:CheY-like chemotaxis protein